MRIRSSRPQCSAGLAGSKTAGEALGSYLPQHALYKALKEKLAEARKQKGDNAPTRIGAGPVLKTGKILVQDERVPALAREARARPATRADITYDKELEDAVAKFQKQNTACPPPARSTPRPSTR